MAAQAGLCLAWSETPEDTFSHGPAHIKLEHSVTGKLKVGVATPAHFVNRTGMLKPKTKALSSMYMTITDATRMYDEG